VLDFILQFCHNESNRTKIWLYKSRVDAAMRMIGLFLLLILLSLQYKLWFGDGSIIQSVQLEKTLARQQEENNQLAARNRAVEADIVELKSGDQALEEQARYDLGMVKQGEVYYQFVD
jgi:cell division protein FtsB